MNALSHWHVLVESNPTQAPLGQGREGAPSWDFCWDEQTRSQDEVAFEVLADGAGI
jgi:hypothetical protein